MGWFEERFIENTSKLRFNCVICEKSMWFPLSKHEKYLTCGNACSKIRLEQIKQSKKRLCEKCGVVFFPRAMQIKQGHGRFCSQKCNTAKIKFATTVEAIKKRSASYKKTMEAKGYKKGVEHPKWKGGQKATVARRLASGKARESVKNYRKNNPEKVREFALRRKSRSYGRLPRGFIKQLLLLQKNKCVICRTDVSKKYHVDHVIPLAKNGEHKPDNIQILCPSCNVRKSSKDPINYMQSLGFLL
jgi:5-methylcytosine-specific restriction endonuclease McrA